MGEYVDPAGYLHTTFALSGGGEYLALVQPDGVTAWYHSDFGPQYSDISYGYLQTQERDFMITPTPGAENVAVDVGLTFVDDAMVLTAERGFYDGSFEPLKSSKSRNACTFRLVVLQPERSVLGTSA